MRLRKIFTLFLCFSLIINFISCTNNKKVFKNNNSEVFEKKNYLGERIYGYTSVRELLQLTKEQDISYAGCFIKTDEITKKSILNIVLVYNSARNIENEELLRRIEDVNKKGIVKIVDAKFSLSELKSANEVLINNLDRLSKKGLKWIAVDEEKNRIIVTVKKITDEIKTDVSELVDMSIVILEESLCEIQLTANLK